MARLDELLAEGLSYRPALAIGLVVSLLVSFLVTRRSIPKLLGAHVTGRDIHKPGRPEIPEMGGLSVFIACNVGAFAILGLAPLADETRALILASLVVTAGACITGVIDDMIELRQRFKAFIPFAFAAPLVLFVDATYLDIPFLGRFELGLVYSLLIVPTAVACASNGFNMLEGMNGLGTGLGIILTSSLAFLVLFEGDPQALTLLLPLFGALGGFLWYNAFPSRIFPGDSMTLTTGAMVACGAILGKVEFWAGLLMLPWIVEFYLKFRSHFRARSFASRVEQDGTLIYEGRIQSLTHIFMKLARTTEPGIVARMWLSYAGYSVIIVSAAYLT